MAAVLVLALAGEARSARDTAISGNDFLEWCTSTPKPSEFICVGYLLGTVEMILLVHEIGTDAAFPCLPDNVIVRQYKDIVVRWLKDHPELRHEGALTAVILALKEAFPCE